MQRWRLYTVVFTSGAAVMAFELAGSRVLAPWVGTSIVAWTSLIGTILASLSAGYWYGGRLADRGNAEALLSRSALWAALAMAVTALIHSPVMEFVSSATVDVRLSSLLGTLLLFTPGAFWAGTVSPLAAKLAIVDLTTDGRTVGTLYALSTAGSILGTFAAGFWLIPFLGTTTTVAVLAVAVGLASFLAAPKRVGVTTFVVLVVAVSAPFQDAALAGGRTLIDTPYQRLIIGDYTDRATGRPVRFLATDPYGLQAAMFVDGGPDEPVFGYLRGFRQAEELTTARRTLTIGGAAYTWPGDFLRRNLDAEMTVVEIDPGMTDAARRYFGLRDEPRMTIMHEDGRTFLNRNEERFDTVYLDAFSGTTLPFHLVTREAVARVGAALEPHGVVVANIIGAFEGPDSRIVGAITSTFQAEFPWVRLIRVGSAGAATRQNILLLAGYDAFDAHLGPLVPWTGALPAGTPLTDDRAPVELLMLPPRS